MTKRECAIVMAYTGKCMLEGEDFRIFHEYVEELMDRPVFTHELAFDEVSDEIVKRSEKDFIELCKNAV